MMTLNKIPFKEVNGAGLFVDTVYEGGSDKNISSEVILDSSVAPGYHIREGKPKTMRI